MHVLHVSQTTTEGVGQLIADMVADQTARGWHVTVASPSSGTLEAACARVGATHHEWRARRGVSPLRLPGELRSLGRVIAGASPDVVSLHSSKAGLVGRLVVRGRRPTVFTPSAWSFLHEGRLLRSLSRLWERSATRWATTILCVSEAERTRGERAGLRASWRVVPNAVDLTTFTPAAAGERDSIRAALGLDGRAPTAVCVGRLAPQKGQDLLIEAWAEVRAAVPDAALVLVGDGPELEQLERSAGPGVRFVGRQRDVRAWLVAADVVVQPSRWEGMSFVALEALACGSSIVATDVDGMREVIGEGDEAVGVLIPVEDVPRLASAIVERLAEPDVARREGERARARAAQFGLTEWGTRVARVFEEAVGVSP